MSSETGRSLKESGVKKVLSNVAEEYRERVDTAILNLARCGEPFTAEDVRKLSGDPPHPNAMGAMMCGASKSGWIQPVGYRQATRDSAHGRILRVYVGNSTPFGPKEFAKAVRRKA